DHLPRDRLRPDRGRPRPGRCDHNLGAGRRAGPCAPARARNAVRTDEHRKGVVSGTKGLDRETVAPAEVQGAQLLALQPLRAAARRLQEIRALPDLPPRSGPRGRDPGHDEIELVMQTDPIADMLTRIRNANKALHERAEMPSSRMKADIARLLKEEGYIRDFRIVSSSEFNEKEQDKKKQRSEEHTSEL